MSVKYLEKALQLAHDLGDKKKAAEVHLNTSTMLSQTGK